MNDYVFVDPNNGHFEEYYNFTSNATEKEILNVIEEMNGGDSIYSIYRRMGMRLHDLGESLVKKGFKFERQNNSRDRRYIDRISIYGTGGNY